MLARAFANDPAMSFIFPDPEQRARRLPSLFALLFDSDGRAGMRLKTPGDTAATLWRGPGKAHIGVFEMLGQALPMLHALGGATVRALTVSKAIDAHHPGGAYWYLHVAGCEPIAQGQGLGGSVVRSGLERVSGGGLPAYLETATEANLSFYQRLGFRITSEWRVPRGGPLFWSMMRDGRDHAR